jgi:transposase
VEVREVIRKAKFKDGKSNRQIALELGISRNTVKRVVSQEKVTIPVYRRTQPVQYPIMGPYLGLIEDWLREDMASPRKQRHTGKRIYDRLVEEYQFPGSYRRVLEIVAKFRQKPKEVYLPLAFQPGEMAQADWIEDLHVLIAGKPCKVQVLNLVLNYSGSVYCEAFEHARQEAFFQGQRQAFEFWGGIPGTVTYDNLKSAVQKVLEGKNREENERFIAFRSAYLFESRFCNPARGNEKGRVENMVKFVQRNFFTPIPQVDSLAELNALLRKRCEAYLKHTQARQNETVNERLQQEQSHFLPLPKFPPECCRVIPVKVSKTSLVQFETNRYSVPSEYAYQTLWLKAFVDRVEITTPTETVVTHPRLNGKYQESIRFEHYAKVLERKPGGQQHLKGTGMHPLSSKKHKDKVSTFPHVHVQPPNLSQYSQLLRSIQYDPTTGTFTGNPSEETSPAQYSQAVP